jgi:leucyl/phenylalanyl-tRNA--protein transferase
MRFIYVFYEAAVSLQEGCSLSRLKR